MTLHEMNNVGIAVENLDAAIAFFTELGMELEGKAHIEGSFADRTVGLEGTSCEVAMLRTPDGHGRLELAQYLSPAAFTPDPPHTPPNTIGFHRVMFRVSDIDDVVARLQRLGGELVGEIAQYEQSNRLCYLRGPSGITIGLAETIG